MEPAALPAAITHEEAKVGWQEAMKKGIRIVFMAVQVQLPCTGAFCNRSQVVAQPRYSFLTLWLFQVPTVPSRNRLLGFLAQRLKASPAPEAAAEPALQAKDAIGRASSNKSGTPDWSVASEASEGSDAPEKEGHTSSEPDQGGPHGAAEAHPAVLGQGVAATSSIAGKSGLRDWLTRLTGAYSTAGAVHSLVGQCPSRCMQLHPDTHIFAQCEAWEAACWCVATG